MNKVILLFCVSIATGFDKLCMNCKHFKKDIFTPSKFAQCIKFLITDTNVDHLIDGKRREEKKKYVLLFDSKII